MLKFINHVVRVKLYGCIERLHKLGMTFLINVVTIASWSPAWYWLANTWYLSILTARTIADK